MSDEDETVDRIRVIRLIISFFFCIPFDPNRYFILVI